MRQVNGNGTYTSDPFTPLAGGTYQWVAIYSGDANNHGAVTACSDPSAAVTVAKRTPTLSASASLLSLGSIADTATINGADPTGSITFSLYGPNNLVCSGAPIFTSVKSVTGSGSYVSDSFAPTAAGTYQWVASYTGDANNNPAGTICADLLNSVVAAGNVVPGFSLSLNPLVVKPAGVLTVAWSNVAKPTAYDWVGLFAAGAPDWAVKTWKYTDGAASGSTSLTVPWGTAPGAYEVRLFANNSTTRIGTATVTVVA
jgi:hypothetical protein